MGSELILSEGAAPSTPSSGKITVYAKTDGFLYGKDDSGTESALSGGISESTIDAKGDLLTGSADNTVSRLPVGDDGQIIIADSSEAAGMRWTTPLSSQYRLIYKNTDYTMSFTDQVIICYNTTGTVTITIPDLSSLTNTGTGNEYLVLNFGTGVVEVDASGTDTFVNGLGTMVVPKNIPFRFAIAYPLLGSGILRTNTYNSSVQVRRSSTWASSNFTSATPIPFDTNDQLDDSYLYTWSSGTNPSRVTVNADGRCKVTYWVAVDSTGGSSYQVEAYLRVNGTTTINGSNAKVGNYQTEDSHMSISSVEYLFESGDYVELVLDNTNLTGNVNNVTMIVSTDI